MKELKGVSTGETKSPAIWWACTVRKFDGLEDGWAYVEFKATSVERAKLITQWMFPKEHGYVVDNLAYLTQE